MNRRYYRKALLLYLVGLFLLALPLMLSAGLEQGLVLDLPLTKDLKDHSPSAHPIQVVGKVRAEADGAYFGGRRDWLEAPHIPLNKRPFAIALWIRETTSEPTVGLVEQYDVNRPLRVFGLLLRNHRNPYLGFMNMDLVATSYRVPTNSEWVHLVFQYDGQRQQIWIDGRYLCSREAPAFEGDEGVTAIGKLSRWSNMPGKDFVGHMRDFRIYHRVLGHEEIGQLAGINQPGPAEKTPAVAAASLPTLSKSALASRESAAQLLSSDPSLPFLEISGQQIIINGRAGQVYTLQASGDLDTWRALARMTNQTGRLVYEDKDQRFTPKQFFRVKIEGAEP